MKLLTFSLFILGTVSLHAKNERDWKQLFPEKERAEVESYLSPQHFVQKKRGGIQKYPEQLFLFLTKEMAREARDNFAREKNKERIPWPDNQISLE